MTGSTGNPIAAPITNAKKIHNTIRYTAQGRKPRLLVENCDPGSNRRGAPRHPRRCWLPL